MTSRLRTLYFTSVFLLVFINVFILNIRPKIILNIIYLGKQERYKQEKRQAKIYRHIRACLYYLEHSKTSY